VGEPYRDFQIIKKDTSTTYFVSPNNINIPKNKENFIICKILSKCMLYDYGDYKSVDECNSVCETETCKDLCGSAHESMVKKIACNKNCKEYPCFDRGNGQCASINNKEECLKNQNFYWCGN
jgi:hypothetical protein